MTPYYSDSSVTIYNGDCREVLGQLQFAAIVTDPPYGIRLDTRARYERNADHLPITGDDLPFDPAWLLAFDVPTILWGANHYASRLPDCKGWLAWVKVIYDGAFGTRSMDKKQAEMELAWTNCVSRPKSLRHLWDGVFRDSESGTRYHPAQKPVALMQWCLTFLSGIGGTIVDPYCGSGPTLRAAKDIGRSAIGIEIEERYCEIAAERCRQEVLELGA